MKVSRNSTINVTHSSSHKSSPKPTKSSSSSSSSRPSKTVTKPITGHYTAKTGINSQVSKKDNKSSETIVPKKTVSKKDSATSKTIKVKDVASKKDSLSSKAVETKKVTSGYAENRSHVNAVSVTKPVNVVKTEHTVSAISSSNSKKNNNTDKRKKTDNKQSAGGIRRGYYNPVRITQNKGTTVRVFADKSEITQTLNGSAITIPKEFIPKGKKKDGKFQAIAYLLNNTGKAGKKILSDMVKMAYEQGDKLVETVSTPEFRQHAHDVFSTAGLVFPVGDFADIALYLAEKNNKEALMSLVAVLPIGDALKVAKKGVKIAAKTSKSGVKAVKESKKAIKLIDKNTGKLVKAKNKNLIKDKDLIKDGKKITKELKYKYNEETVEKSKKKFAEKATGCYTHETELFKKWKKDADEHPSEIKNRIFEKLKNYWDTTKDTSGKAINLERQGDFDAAVREFKSFVDENTISNMKTKYGDGLKGKIKGKLNTKMDGKINISVRPGSRTGGSTVEIVWDEGKKFKIRFKENKQ